MRTRNGVVVAVIKPVRDTYRVAVLKRVKNWEGWELVKGGTEEDDILDAARREIHEETGIERIEKIEELDRVHEWEYERDNEKIHAAYRAVLAIVPEDATITLDQNECEEHEDGYFLNFRDAIDILTHENQKALLREMRERLEGGNM